MSAATQIYYASFDAVFVKLPPALRARIQQKIDEIGLRLQAYPHHRLKGSNRYRARVGDYRIIYTFDLEITLNFGMVVAIYYFLHSAKIALKLFTFFAYAVGMLVLLGQMLVETNIKQGAIESLRALPADHLSRPVVRYLSVYDSWVALSTRITFNLSVWLFMIGVFYLLFLWKRNSTAIDS